MKSVFSFQFDNYRMSILSCPWSRQFYGIGRLHLPRI